MLIILPALRKEGPKIDLSIRTPVIILLSVCTFALVVPLFGVVPAIFATVFLSSLADRRLKPWLSAVISVSPTSRASR